MEKLRWGIAGPGNIARKFASAAKNTEGAELYAVASSSSLDRAAAFAEQHGIPHAFGSYEEMAACPHIDCVYVATPHPFHKPCAEIFIKAGKHILCEKPLCVNAKDAKALFALAKQHGVFLMEAMWTRFLPAVREAVAFAKSGRIGELLGLDCTFAYSIAPAAEPKIFDPDMAGGSLLDVGVYNLHLSAMLFGDEPKSIQAVSDVRGGVDCHTAVTLAYEGGAIARLCSATVLRRPDEAILYGTRGTLRLPSFYGAQEFICEDYTKGTTETYAYPYLGNGFEEEILAVMQAVQEGKTESDILPHAATLTVLEQMDEIRRLIGVRYRFDD